MCRENNFRTSVHPTREAGNKKGSHLGSILAPQALPSSQSPSQPFTGPQALPSPQRPRAWLLFEPLSKKAGGGGELENPAKSELKMTKQLIRSEVTRKRNKSH